MSCEQLPTIVLGIAVIFIVVRVAARIVGVFFMQQYVSGK